MYALEPEPEQNQRWKRLVVGGCVAAVLATGTLFAAKNVAPMRRLLPDVLQLAVIDEPPPPPPLPATPPPPPPPPPPPKKQPEAKPEEKVKAEEPKAEEKPKDEASSEPDVGLDAASFGGSGLAFRAGTTQMGDPNRPAKTSTEPAPVLAKAATKLRPARALNPVLPKYPERARRLNLEGEVLIEVDIDARGKLTNVRVKQGLAPELDLVAVASVKSWRFEPATLAGQATSSTGILRFKFSLV